jgi:hypothetical protein
VKYLTSWLQWIPLAILLLVLGGCNTTPEKPHQPQTQPQVQPPPPPTQSQSEREQQSAQSGGQPQPNTQQSQSQSQPDPSGFPPPDQAESAPPSTKESADVEITDIPVDENGNPIIDPNPPPASNTAQNQNSPQQSPSSSSGSAAPPRNADSGGSSGSGTQMAGAEGGPEINIGAVTEAERVAALEQDLDGKLAKFDELMRRAREDAERDRINAGGGNSGARDGQAPPPNGRGAGSQAQAGSGRGHNPDLAGSGGKGEFKYAGGSVPNDIQNERDDDIVARQLREAATSESDPALREKLWDEYRKYKKGIGR